MTIEREIPSNVSSVLTSQHTKPYYLVRIDFGTGSLYMSTGQQTTHQGNTYIEAAVRVGSFSWDGDGTQTGQIGLLNEANAASALILNNKIADTPVRIYKVYSTGPSTNTTPVLFVKGVLDTSTLNPTEAILDVITSRAQNELVPNRFHNQEAGFNWLPKAGSLITWNTERYELVAD